jgi:predicted ATPase
MCSTGWAVAGITVVAGVGSSGPSTTASDDSGLHQDLSIKVTRKGQAWNRSNISPGQTQEFRRSASNMGVGGLMCSTGWAVAGITVVAGVGSSGPSTTAS